MMKYGNYIEVYNNYNTLIIIIPCSSKVEIINDDNELVNVMCDFTGMPIKIDTLHKHGLKMKIM